MKTAFPCGKYSWLRNRKITISSLSANARVTTRLIITCFSKNSCVIAQKNSTNLPKIILTNTFSQLKLKTVTQERSLATCSSKCDCPNHTVLMCSETSLCLFLAIAPLTWQSCIPFHRNEKLAAFPLFSIDKLLNSVKVLSNNRSDEADA